MVSDIHIVLKPRSCNVKTHADYDDNHCTPTVNYIKSECTQDVVRKFKASHLNNPISIWHNISCNKKSAVNFKVVLLVINQHWSALRSFAVCTEISRECTETYIIRVQG